MGEEKLQALLQESLAVATKTEAINPSDLNRVIVDTTVQAKNVMFPTDARLLNRAHEILVRLAKRQGLALRQTYARVGSSPRSSISAMPTPSSSSARISV
jgi:transposase, IS5 family